jgi:hypothetical protein
MLLLAFPELKTESGPVSKVLDSIGVTENLLNTWRELVAQEISAPDDDDEFA